ncbi:MAG: hypothetical protein KR126chlam1_01100 [Chlamydiae bacterium]|nr:hypothetical protein [Chlamydiota bacterium]
MQFFPFSLILGKPKNQLYPISDLISTAVFAILCGLSVGKMSAFGLKREVSNGFNLNSGEYVLRTRAIFTTIILGEIISLDIGRNFWDHYISSLKKTSGSKLPS